MIGPHDSLGSMASLRGTRDRLINTFAAGFPYSRFAQVSELVEEMKPLRYMFRPESYKGINHASMLLLFPRAMGDG